MIKVKVNKRWYKTLCGCDEEWKNQDSCYGDETCPVCGYFPWASSKKSATVLSMANIKRLEEVKK